MAPLSLFPLGNKTPQPGGVVFQGCRSRSNGFLRGQSLTQSTGSRFLKMERDKGQAKERYCSKAPLSDHVVSESFVFAKVKIPNVDF
jgi:hypothetical protein